MKQTLKKIILPKEPYLALANQITIISILTYTPLLIVSFQLKDFHFFWPEIINAVSISAIVVVSTILALKISKFFGFILLTFFTLLVSVVRLSYLLLINFSGRGFTDEVFFHLELESLRIGWEEYGLVLIACFISIAAIILLTTLTIRYSYRIKNRNLLSFFIVFFSIFWLTLPASPENKLILSYLNFNQSFETPIPDEESFDLLSRSGIISELPINKNKVIAKTREKPKNLILIYLESFNLGLTEYDKYPGLTPNLEYLKNRYGYSDYFFTSGYVTIEGIVDSQCGIIVPMKRGSDSFMQEKGRFRMLPCLADVLNRAGYHQVYLGGAEMEFASKGDFLLSHGYDEVKGWRYWQSNGYQNKKDVWGLPDDILFNNAIELIKDLRKTKQIPFNLTLLTLGTHLPGFTYDSCEPYRLAPDEKFLNAIHCTDHIIGQFFHTLEKENLLSDTVVVVTADHGIFPTPKMRELFGDVVEDKRLVSIIINDGIGTPFTRPMASYDLAPTLLDLLEIDHNAHFLLGKSSLRDDSGSPYFYTRYGDFAKIDSIESKKNRSLFPWKGKGLTDWYLVHNNQSLCESNDIEYSDITIPLDPCEKKSFMLAMETILNQFNWYQENQKIFFEKGTFVGVNNDNSISIKNGKKYLEHSFSRKGRFVDPEKDGIYLMLSDKNDYIESMTYFDLSLEEDRKKIMSDIWTETKLPKNFLLIYKPTSIAQQWEEALKKFFSETLYIDDMKIDSSLVAYGCLENGKASVQDFRSGNNIELELAPIHRLPN